MTVLYEKYRPKSWAEVVAQSKVVERLKTLAARDGLGGRYISGATGIGS
jgi:DNA polymerase III gamma/tau subunit